MREKKQKSEKLKLSVLWQMAKQLLPWKRGKSDMPNNGRITLCPYYRDEKNKSISCEDTFRRFRYTSQKNKWLDMYCDDKWEECPHAISITRMYERMEDMSEYEQELLQLRETNKALRAELKKTAMLLGKAEKRLEKNAEKLEQIRAKHRAAENLYLKYREKTEQYIAKEKDMQNILHGYAYMYEARFAYLMSESGMELNEKLLDEWLKTHEYRIIPNENPKERIYSVEVRDANRGPAGEDAEASKGKTEKK